MAEGSRVKAGEVIARIDNRDVLAQAESARGERARGARGARAGGGRGARRRAAAEAQRRSARQGASCPRRPSTRPTARHDRATAGVASARAAIGVAEANARNARVAVDFTLIRAPFDGVILSKSANVGDMITPFSSAADSKGAVVTMADMATLEVEADVSESSLSKVRVGQPGEIMLDALPDDAVPRAHQPHRPDRRPGEGDGDDQGAVRRARSAHPARDERQGRVPVAGGLARAAAAADRGRPRRARVAPGRSVVFVIRDGVAVEVPVTGASRGRAVAITGAGAVGRAGRARPGAGSRRRRAREGRDEVSARVRRRMRCR